MWVADDVDFDVEVACYNDRIVVCGHCFKDFLKFGEKYLRYSGATRAIDDNESESCTFG
jgi:hypothetical protein